MTLSFSRIGAILKKEFLQLKRDPATAAMVVMIPIMQLLLFGYAINNDPKHLHTAVLSKENSLFARSFITSLENSSYFHMMQEISSDEEGRHLLQQGKVSFVVTLPDHFAQDLIRGQKPSILIEADATDPTTTAGALGALSGVLTSALLKDFKGPLSFLCPRPAPYTIVVHRLYNPEGFTNYNIVPGLIGVLLMMTGIMVTALSLTREKERGTMENMLSMPVRPIEVILGKIVPYILIGYIQSAIIIFMAKFLFSIPIMGSKGLLALALLIFIICNLAFGLMI
ncbi:MAG: ABC transporter permease, partial [Holosporales bacterium]|nr:ABC transporter permease [Holosporales bacterium]